MNGPEPVGEPLSVQMERAMEVKQAYESELLSKANVVGVGVGLRRKSGEYTGAIALVVIVERKLDRGELSISDLLPRELDGFPVDVQEVGQITT